MLTHYLSILRHYFSILKYHFSILKTHLCMRQMFLAFYKTKLQRISNGFGYLWGRFTLPDGNNILISSRNELI